MTKLRVTKEEIETINMLAWQLRKGLLNDIAFEWQVESLLGEDVTAVVKALGVIQKPPTFITVPAATVNNSRASRLIGLELVAAELPLKLFTWHEAWSIVAQYRQSDWAELLPVGITYEMVMSAVWRRQQIAIGLVRFFSADDGLLMDPVSASYCAECRSALERGEKLYQQGRDLSVMAHGVVLKTRHGDLKQRIDTAHRRIFTECAEHDRSL